MASIERTFNVSVGQLQTIQAHYSLKYGVSVTKSAALRFLITEKYEEIQKNA